MNSTVGRIRRERRLGDVLIARNLITKDELWTALGDQAESGRKLGEILVDRCLLDPTDLDDALTTQMNLLFLDLSRS